MYIGVVDDKGNLIKRVETDQCSSREVGFAREHAQSTTDSSVRKRAQSLLLASLNPNLASKTLVHTEMACSGGHDETEARD